MIISSLLFYDDVSLFYIYNYVYGYGKTPFVGGGVFVVVLFFKLYVFIIFRARHDHNKIAACGIIKVFFNWIEMKPDMGADFFGGDSQPFHAEVSALSVGPHQLRSFCNKCIISTSQSLHWSKRMKNAEMY